MLGYDPQEAKHSPVQINMGHILSGHLSISEACMRVTMASCHGEGLALRMLLLEGVEPCERFFGHWACTQKGLRNVSLSSLPLLEWILLWHTLAMTCYPRQNSKATAFHNPEPEINLTSL